MLLAAQCHQWGIVPTRIAGFRTWLKLGRCARKGEVALRVLAPVTVKDRDEHAGEEAETRRVVFKTGFVFDVSQIMVLDGAEPATLEAPHQPLTGDSHAHLLTPLGPGAPPRHDDSANRARLTDPVARIGFLVMRHAGLRISSACSLKLDCLAVDPGGQPWLMYLDHKGDDEDLVPISAEIADEIRAQQQRVRERFASTPWLLPAERANRDGGKHIDDGEVRRRLRRWVLACDIREQSGHPIEFKPHRFRHTIATELINRGMSKTGIQRFLSHESGAMTDVYAHMLDQTLKQEWLATKERVNAAGERVALTTPLIDDDAAWLKHQFARAKQTLPDGECGLPIQQSCPHPNACHSCPHFLTDERYRPVLEEQLTRAEQRVADAERAGHERVAEINRPDVLDLRRIIAGPDRLGA